MDIKMPVRDGIDAASEIAAKRLAPVVMLTAFSRRDFVEKARDAGAMAYLVKAVHQGRPRAGHRGGGQPLPGGQVAPDRGRDDAGSARTRKLVGAPRGC